MTDQAKPTPGPWYLSEKLSGSENHKGYTLSARRKADYIWLADISPQNGLAGDPTPEGKATARCIAQARRGYELAKMLVAWDEKAIARRPRPVVEIIELARQIVQAVEEQ